VVKPPRPWKSLVGSETEGVALRYEQVIAQELVEYVSPLLREENPRALQFD
jgi:hypothetical protein